MQSDAIQEIVENELGGPYFPFNRRESYPKRMKVDFRRLPRKTLLTYMAHHDLHVRPDSTQEELAIAAARHFLVWRVNEEAIMRSFCAGIATSSFGVGRGLGDNEAADRKRKRLNDSFDDDYPLDVVPPSPECRGSNTSSSVYHKSFAKNGRNRPVNGNNGNGNGYNKYDSSSSGGGGAYHGGGGGAARKIREGGAAQPPPPHLRIAPQAAKVQRTPRQAPARVSTTATGGAKGRGRAFSEFETDEQVAACVDRADQQLGGPPRAWILARVACDKKNGRVELRDEDDASHVFELPCTEVSHLQDFSGDLQKRDKVLAVYPDTTMFYCATIAKGTPRMEGNSKVMAVRFEDDDVNGKTCFRHVPVGHIILQRDETAKTTTDNNNNNDHLHHQHSTNPNDGKNGQNNSSSNSNSQNNSNSNSSSNQNNQNNQNNTHYHRHSSNNDHHHHHHYAGNTTTTTNNNTTGRPSNNYNNNHNNSSSSNNNNNINSNNNNNNNGNGNNYNRNSNNNNGNNNHNYKSSSNNNHGRNGGGGSRSGGGGRGGGNRANFERHDDHHQHHQHYFTAGGVGSSGGGGSSSKSSSGGKSAGGSDGSGGGYRRVLAEHASGGGGGGGRNNNNNSNNNNNNNSNNNNSIRDSGGIVRNQKKAGTTYADMIAHALGRVEGGRGAFTAICNIIEGEFSDVLNWKLESDVRKTPVWKSSVRKILFSNSRFAHCSTTPELGHVFTMARMKK